MDQRDRLICDYLPLVHRCVAEVTIDRALREDLVQAGSIGLIHAADHFDPTRGVHFAAYARASIRGALRHHLRARVSIRPWLREQPPVHPQPDTLAEHAALRQAVAQLPHEEQLVVILMFWDGLSQREVAERLGRSQMHVSRVLRRSLDYLHEELGP